MQIEALSFHHYLLHGTLITHEEVQAFFQPGEPETVKDAQGQDVVIPADFVSARAYTHEEYVPSLTSTPRPPPASHAQVFPVPTHRYLLGISDLTGELMRFATNAIGGGGGKGSGPPSDPGAVVRSVLSLLRSIREGLDPFVFLVRDMGKKQAVTTASLRKIEDRE